MCAAAAAMTAAPVVPQADYASARAAASALPQLHGLLVSHRGQLVLEYYAKGYSAGRLANIKSASKSIIAALVGIAIERKLIAGVREPIARWFPELRKDADPRRQAITIEDLLTMRSGLESTSGGELRAMGEQPQLGALRAGAADGQRSRDVDGIQHGHVAPPLGDPDEGVRKDHAPVRRRGPGEAARHHAGALAARSAGHLLRRQRDADDAAADDHGRGALAEPTAGRRARRSCRPPGSRRPASRARGRGGIRIGEYGYGWWSQTFDGHRACFAWGFGGQYIFVFRELDLVVAVTSATTVSDERRGYRRQLFDLLETHVLPPAGG